MAVAQTQQDLSEQFREFLATHYRDAIGELAQHYPKEQRALDIEYSDLATFDADLAEQWVTDPNQLEEYAAAGLQQVELPVDVDLSGADVRLVDLDPGDTIYPGGFSKTERHNERPYLTIVGNVEKQSEANPKVVETCFECERCGTPTYIPQTGRADDFQEPHECQGCERQGPFRVDFDQSTFVDAQTLRIVEPPERARGGEGAHIDVHVEDDLVDQCEPGDRVAVTGIFRLAQQTSQNAKSSLFEGYVSGRHIEIRQTTFEDLDITPADREEIEALAARDDLFDLAVDSIVPRLTGEKIQTIKEALFLSLVGGVSATPVSGGGRATAATPTRSSSAARRRANRRCSTRSRIWHRRPSRPRGRARRSQALLRRL